MQPVANFDYCVITSNWGTREIEFIPATNKQLTQLLEYGSTRKLATPNSYVIYVKPNYSFQDVLTYMLTDDEPQSRL